MKTVAIHQPNYLPWAGYFYKMIRCDDFIFGDTVPMSKPSFTSRNRIKAKEGAVWLSVPCSRVVGETLIKDVKCADDWWRPKHLRKIEESYNMTPYFKDYMPRLKEIICSDETRLAALNIQLIKQIVEWLDISCTFHVASELGHIRNQNDSIVDLVTRVGGDTYLSGFGGAHYQNADELKKANIDLVYYDFRPPVYPQLWGDFEAGLSVMDLLFNCGPDSTEILERCGSKRSECEAEEKVPACVRLQSPNEIHGTIESAIQQ